MSTNTFDDFDEESQETLQGMEFISFEDMQRGIIGRDPFAGIRTNKTIKDISNEIALSTPFGKQSSFYRTTYVNQTVRNIGQTDVNIRIMVEDDAEYVREEYRKEVVPDNMIKLYLVVKDESIIDRGKQDDIRNANIRVSNISEFVGVVLGDKMFHLFNDYPEKMDEYVDKLAKDFIEDDSQLPLVKKTLEGKFNHYMQNKRSVLFPLGDIAQMIQNELKKDLQEFWKPILSSLANEIRALKIKDEKYWQPYTVQGKLKPDKDFVPLIGEKASDAQAYAASFLERFRAMDKVLVDYLNLNKIEDAKNLKPASRSKLKIALAKIYELFKAFFGYFKAGIVSFIEFLSDQVYQLNAFLVGVINGVIEFIASLFDMIAFISGLLSGDAHEFWQAIKKAFKTLEEKGAFVYVFEALGKFFDAITKRYNTKQTKYKILKNLGEDLIGIVEFVLGTIAVLKTAKAVANASKKLYENFKKKVDDILGKHKDEFDEVNKRELYSQIKGKPIDPVLLKKLQKEFEEIGGEMRFDEESFAYCEARAKTLNTEVEAINLSEDLIMLNKTVTKSAVYEELIHAEQHRTGRFKEAVENIKNNEIVMNLMEKEAAEKLLLNAEKWDLPNEEIEVIKERLEYFKEELKRLDYEK